MKITNLGAEKASSTDSCERHFADDVAAGLGEYPKRLSAKYYYDDRGSELFQRITEQPEYFVTRAERSVLRGVQSILPELVGEQELDVIELGPGNGEKAKILIDGFLGAGCRVNYYPIDISAKAMELIRECVPEVEGLTIHGVVSEYIHGLHHIRRRSQNPFLVLFLGSSIGNFQRDEQQEFLKTVRSALGVGDLLMMGFDVRKDPQTHISSFNDAAGVTAEFNLNLLRRINRELGGDALLSNFKYYSYFNPVIGAMESYLVSLIEQEVRVERLERTFTFAAFEPIHVEYSFKLRPSEVDDLARASGFSTQRSFMHPEGLFLDSLWRARPLP